MEMYIFLLIGLFSGGLIGFLWAKTKFSSSEDHSSLVASLEQDLSILRAQEKATLSSLAKLEQQEVFYKTEHSRLSEELKVKETELKELTENYNQAYNKGAQLMIKRDHLQEQVTGLNEEHEELTKNLELKVDAYNELYNQKSVIEANLKEADNKLDRQAKDIEELQKMFKLEFEKMANSILDQKTAKFTQTNKDNLKQILDPLNKDIEAFKSRVNEVYEKESKQRFSLEEKVKELQELNQSIGEEARNLTKALKGEVKTQGRWGEMILESILEKSGLRKGEEYEMEVQLTDEDGKALRSDSEDKKMRPDAVINYPDNRKVIIDSKVSLNAYSRSIEAQDLKEQQRHLNDHVQAIKNHIMALSRKGYDDYDKALDFVMMFIPSEAAYIAAIKQDPELWNYAYDKRILLMNPTNLITSLKLIVDLWNREYQNQNAIAIAERGGKLYDKFVGFVTNLDKVGDYISKAQKSYGDAYGQLSSGKDNLVRQASKLKELGVKTKKDLPKHLNPGD
ncbi:MAG: DNA recombination protein RmuC [Flavobacteriaceae bacterium]